MLERYCLWPILDFERDPDAGGYYVGLLRGYHRARRAASLRCIGVAARMAAVKLAALASRALISAVHHILGAGPGDDDLVRVRPDSLVGRLYRRAFEAAVAQVVEAVRLSIESRPEGRLELPLVLEAVEARYLDVAGMTLVFEVGHRLEEAVWSRLDGDCTLLGSIHSDDTYYECKGRIVCVIRQDEHAAPTLVITHGPPASAVRVMADILIDATNPRNWLVLLSDRHDDETYIEKTLLDADWLGVLECADSMVEEAEHGGLRGVAAVVDECIIACRNTVKTLASALMDESSFDEAADLLESIGSIDSILRGGSVNLINEYDKAYRLRLFECMKRVYGAQTYYDDDDPDWEYGGVSWLECRLYYKIVTCITLARLRRVIANAIRRAGAHSR